VLDAAARTTVFEEAAPAECLHIVLDGAVELFTRLGEHEATVALLERGGVFVLAAVASEGSSYPVSARTMRASRILTLQAILVRDVFDRDASFARAVARLLSDEFYDVLNDLKNRKLRDSLERLADWLLRADARLGGTQRLTLPVDKRILASQLGMTPEHLSRNLKYLSGHGIVVEGRRVVLTDLAALSEIASRRGRPNGSNRHRGGNSREASLKVSAAASP
jgi:CRP/FNR family transcriptional activator FtrB